MAKNVISGESEKGLSKEALRTVLLSPLGSLYYFFVPSHDGPAFVPSHDGPTLFCTKS